MKNKILKIIKYLFILMIGIFIGLNIFDSKDANRDGRVNAQDYVIIKNYIMEGCDN